MALQQKVISDSFQLKRRRNISLEHLWSRSFKGSYHEDKGATNIDKSDYIKPELHHQPDVIILHCGTNNIPNSE